jgi:regulator of sirC expression with transglutaminase-like and TPR domain
MIAVYLQVGDMPHVIDAYQRLVTLVPNKPTYWSQYAAAYAQAGKITEAVATTREAMARFPDDTELQAQARAFLKSLGQ